MILNLIIKWCTSSFLRVCMFSHVQLFVIPWAVARQASLSLEFSRQEYWSGLPFPSPGDPPDPGIEPESPGQQHDVRLFNQEKRVKKAFSVLIRNKLHQPKNFCYSLHLLLGFPGGAEVKVSACNVGDLGSIPGSG